MISKFEGLDPEKQQRIIRASLKEFALKGYKNASTNEIVQDAGISKGLLFHYFTNKKGLFLYVFEYTLNIFVDEFYSKLDFSETDIIERIRQIVRLKVELIHNHLELYDFLINISTDTGAEIASEINNEQTRIIGEFYTKLYQNLDTSRLKEGFEIKQVFDIVFWTSQGFGNSELQKLKASLKNKENYDFDASAKNFDQYIELLKKAFYK